MKEQLLVNQKVDMPHELGIKDFKLFYRDIDLLRLSKKYGTPLRFTYLPAIAEKISTMKSYFKEAINKTKYHGSYTYYYCTKSSHFQHVIKKAMQSDIGIEISSAYDIDLIQSLLTDGLIKKGTKIICNGYKTPEYLSGISALIKQNECHVLPIVDSKRELFHYLNDTETKNCIAIGIRINLSFIPSYRQESRFGLSPKEIVTYYEQYIKSNKNVAFTTLHFFNENGMSSSAEYLKVLEEIVQFYCQLKRLNPQLTTLDIGGGMPFRSTFDEHFDASFFILQLVSTIQQICQEECVPEPNIITEFGKYTVAEASATIFKINEKKQGNTIDWAIIDGSFITHLPDTWAIQQEYPVFPINNLQKDQKPYILGGLTCDSADRYPHKKEKAHIMLPDSDEEQYIAFLHTGAYQEALSGFGGVNHCLIPSPKHIIIDNNDQEFTIFSEKQTSTNLLKILGYH